MNFAGIRIFRICENYKHLPVICLKSWNQLSLFVVMKRIILGFKFKHIQTLNGEILMILEWQNKIAFSLCKQ